MGQKVNLKGVKMSNWVDGVAEGMVISRARDAEASASRAEAEARSADARAHRAQKEAQRTHNQLLQAYDLLNGFDRVAMALYKVALDGLEGDARQSKKVLIRKIARESIARCEPEVAASVRQAWSQHGYVSDWNRVIGFADTPAPDPMPPPPVVPTIQKVVRETGIFGSLKERFLLTDKVYKTEALAQLALPAAMAIYEAEMATWTSESKKRDKQAAAVVWQPTNEF